MVSFEAGLLVEEFLDFSSDIGEEDEEEDNKQSNSNSNNNNFTTNVNREKALSSSSTLALESKPTNPTTTTYQDHEAQTVLDLFDDHHRPIPEFLEEELEWLTNEDAFPPVETFDDIFPGKLCKVSTNHSPNSVLENSSGSSNNSGIMICCASLRVPVRARSKRRRRKRSGFSNMSGQQWWWWCEPKSKSNGGKSTLAAAAANETIMATIGRKCLHCGAEKTPQWRAGPHGPKTLCNACGVRYKSGRLVPEYRPASSPSFSNELHSNSHRKILEMRRQKQQELFMESLDKG